jgi:hypothetical protein
LLSYLDSGGEQGGEHLLIEEKVVGHLFDGKLLQNLGPKGPGTGVQIRVSATEPQVGHAGEGSISPAPPAGNGTATILEKATAQHYGVEFQGLGHRHDRSCGVLPVAVKQNDAGGTGLQGGPIAGLLGRPVPPTFGVA